MRLYGRLDRQNKTPGRLASVGALRFFRLERTPYDKDILAWLDRKN